MKRRKNTKHTKITKHTKLRFTTLIISIIFLIAVDAAAQTPPLQPLPIYEQCPALTAGSSGSDSISQTIETLKTKDEKSRAQAVKQLSESCDQRAVEPLIKLLDNEDPRVRAAAIETLGRLGGPEALQALILSVDDKEPSSRLALTSSLTSFKEFDARIRVVNVLADPGDGSNQDIEDIRLRCIAILTLNQLNNSQYSRKPVLFLYRLLKNESPAVRELAEQTMTALKETRNGSIELVAILKTHSIPELRRWAAYWIGRLGIERGRSVLEEVAAKEPNVNVRQAAVEALKTLKGAEREKR